VLRIRDVYSGSGILIFYPSRIQDPESKNSDKKKGGGKLAVLPVFVAKNITKLKLILFLTGEEKNWANLQRITELITLKIFIKLSEVWDPRSGIRKKTYFGSRIQG
jgi:hypothetical protein